MKEGTFQIYIAGFWIEIENNFPDIRRLCEDYIGHAEHPDYFIRVTAEEIRREQTGSGTFSDGYLETLAVYRKLADWILEKDTVLVHGSAVAVRNRAYLFTAPSGTGKSTHTRLWQKYFGDQAVMINDDKPLVRIWKNSVTVFGTPWNGKHRIGNNISAPLQAICVLRQGTENRIRRLGKTEAFPVLLNQIYRPSEDRAKMEKLLSLTEVLLDIPVWQMDCTISEEAVKLAYKAMKGETEI